MKIIEFIQVTEFKMDARLILSTCPNREAALKISRELVKSGLVACVNILPGMLSVYRWKGALQEEPEELLIIKTTKPNFEKACQKLRELHPYEVPEIVGLLPEHVSEPYLKWLISETSGQ